MLLGAAAQTPGLAVLGVTLGVASPGLVAVPLSPMLANPTGGGQTSIGFALPGNPTLAGVPLYLQAIFFDAGGPQGVSATAGVQATLFAGR